MDEISASRAAISPLTISEMLSEEDAIASLVQIAGSQAGREEDGFFANDIIHDKSGVPSSRQRPRSRCSLSRHQALAGVKYRNREGRRGAPHREPRPFG